ncbi:MAG: ADP-ribosylglycohydrolase family protein [Sulfitobacter sp.]
MSRKISALMGALTADAAGLGLHWLYDVERIAQVVGDGPAAFTPINGANFEGVSGYFAHGMRRDGQLSQYGETLALVMRSIIAEGRFEASAYQAAYAAHFGAGGAYVGYIDRPTRGTLANIAAGVLSPSGVDDDQHPAVATLPAILAKYGNDTARVKAAMEVTNVNKMAADYSGIIATALAAIIDGTDLKDALDAAAKSDPLLQDALNSNVGSVAYGEVTKRACHLDQGVPLSWHILANTTSYQEAVEANIRTGGDSAGRAMIVGALAGAAYGMAEIPDAWLEAMDNSDALVAQAKQLAA